MSAAPELLPFQREGVAALVERPAVLLADDMGLGKTIQAASALGQLGSEDPARRFLVVAPRGLLAQWRSELGRCAPRLSISTVNGRPEDRAWQWRTHAQVYLLSYDTLRSDYSSNPHAPIARHWDVVVLDEAQRIKNRDTEVSRVAKRLARRRSWALTGTPLENSLDELASLLEFLRPLTPGEEPVRVPVNGLLLRDTLARLQLRRKKADVLPELPPKLIERVHIDLGPEQLEAYRRAEEEGIVRLRRLGAEVRVRHVLELIVRLKQLCNFEPVTGASAKAEDLAARLDAVVEEGSRALVFSQFVDQGSGLEALAARLSAYHPLVYSGRQSQHEREAVLHRFKTDGGRPVLLLSLRTGGVGLNLQHASYVFHFDRWWNPAVEAQAEDRTHRYGQQSPVFVYGYIVAGTIEERIERILDEKRALFADIVDGVSFDLAQGLTEQELLGLFDL